jgi:predicted RNase H-like nuclease (RuvC/YqgF family)
LFDDKVGIQKRNNAVATGYKDKIVRQDEKIKKLSFEMDKMVDKLMFLEKTNRTLTGEKDKMKARINKLISRKGKFDSGTKTCKICSKEYNEKENFNWSCRTH